MKVSIRTSILLDRASRRFLYNRNGKVCARYYGL
jgi:hypothetical protein